MEPEFEDTPREDPGGDGDAGSTSEDQFRRRFARIRLIEALSLAAFFLGWGMVVWLMQMSVGTAYLAPSGPGIGFLAGGALLVLAGAIALIANWRCPRCGGYLGQATSVLRLIFPDFWMRFCPHCELRLQ